MTLALYLMHGLPGRPTRGNAEYMWANLLYVNNFLPTMKQYMGYCWSLAIEEQFYLLLSACILLFMGLGKGRIRILVCLTVLSVAIRYIVIYATGIVPPYFFGPHTPAWITNYDSGGFWRESPGHI